MRCHCLQTYMLDEGNSTGRTGAIRADDRRGDRDGESEPMGIDNGARVINCRWGGPWTAGRCRLLLHRGGDEKEAVYASFHGSERHFPARSGAPMGGGPLQNRRKGRALGSGCHLQRGPVMMTMAASSSNFFESSQRRMVSAKRAKGAAFRAQMDKSADGGAG